MANRNHFSKEPGGIRHRAHATISVGPGYPWQVALQQSLRPFHQTPDHDTKGTVSDAQIQNRPNAPTGSGRIPYSNTVSKTLEITAQNLDNDMMSSQNRIYTHPFTCRF
jgi:hypothetical protein